MQAFAKLLRHMVSLNHDKDKGKVAVMSVAVGHQDLMPSLIWFMLE